MPTFLARVRRADHQVGDETFRTVDLELIRDEDAVELQDGDEFVTVELKVDPFEG